MKNKFFIAILILAGGMVNCQQEILTQNCEGDNGKYIETFYTDEYEDIPCSLQNIDAEIKEVNLIVTSQVDYERFFSCSSQLPLIDFDKYLILVGRYRNNNCAVLDSQQVLICDNRIIFRVRILEQDCHAFTNVFYVTVIEKRYNTLPVKFDVQLIN